MRPDLLLVSFLVFTAIIIGGTFIMTDLNTNYGDLGASYSTDDYNDIYNTTRTISGITEDQSDQVLTGGNIESDTTENSMFKGAFSAIRRLGSTFTLFRQILEHINKDIGLGVPSIFIDLAVVALATLVIFSIIYLIFRFRP